MKSKDVFDKVSQIVSEECDVDKIFLTKSKLRKAVEARAILVSVLNELGESDDNIGVHLSMSRQGVNKLRNTFSFRYSTSFSLKIIKQRVSNRVATELAN